MNEQYVPFGDGAVMNEQDVPFEGGAVMNEQGIPFGSCASPEPSGCTNSSRKKEARKLIGIGVKVNPELGARLHAIANKQCRSLSSLLKVAATEYADRCDKEL